MLVTHFWYQQVFAISEKGIGQILRSIEVQDMFLKGRHSFASLQVHLDRLIVKHQALLVFIWLLRHFLEDARQTGLFRLRNRLAISLLLRDAFLEIFGYIWDLEDTV